jgi:tetratricopeptide (TPR) repeat protein
MNGSSINVSWDGDTPAGQAIPLPRSPSSKPWKPVVSVYPTLIIMTGGAMKSLLIICVIVLLVVIVPRQHAEAGIFGDGRGNKSDPEPVHHGHFVLEGACPTIAKEESLEIPGLEGIYRAITPGLKSEGEQYIHFAYQPPPKRRSNRSDNMRKYRVVKGSRFGAGSVASGETSYAVKFLPLTNGFLGVIEKTRPDCRFVVLTKEHEQFVFTELQVPEQVAAQWSEYENLVRFGDSWIQRHETRLFVKYGDTSRALVAFFNRDGAWKPFSSATRHTLVAHMSTEEAKKLAQDRYAQGAAFLEKNDYTNALQEFDRVVQLTPSLPDGYLARGSAHYALQHYANALQDFNNVLDITPDNRDAWLKAADASIQTGDTESAFGKLRRAGFLDPQDGAAQYAFFSLSVVTGDRLSEAWGKCRQAADLNPAYKSCLDVMLKKDAEEQPSSTGASHKLARDQQDFLRTILGAIVIGIVAGALSGSDDDSQGASSGYDSSSRPENPRAKMKSCTRKCVKAAGKTDGEYCTESCSYY